LQDAGLSEPPASALFFCERAKVLQRACSNGPTALGALRTQHVTAQLQCCSGSGASIGPVAADARSTASNRHSAAPCHL